jgi:hypothetical protein
MGAVPGKSFIDGIVDNLIDKMVKSTAVGRADIHCRALPDRRQSPQYLDII